SARLEGTQALSADGPTRQIRSFRAKERAWLDMPASLPTLGLCTPWDELFFLEIDAESRRIGRHDLSIHRHRDTRQPHGLGQRNTGIGAEPELGELRFGHGKMEVLAEGQTGARMREGRYAGG